jgi:hypothetical protein
MEVKNFKRSGRYQNVVGKVFYQLRTDGRQKMVLVRVMMFNGTINNISVISWLSVLLMLKSVAYYRFLFMWYDGIVLPILYLDDGSDYRLSLVELILYM